MVTKTKIVASGSTWTVPDDFVSLVKIRGISAGEGGTHAGRGGVGGTYHEVSDFTGFEIAVGNVLDIQIGETRSVIELQGFPGAPDVPVGDKEPMITWIKDNAGVYMLYVPHYVRTISGSDMIWQAHTGVGTGPSSHIFAIPDPGTVEIGTPSTLSPGGTDTGSNSGSAAGGPRRFLDGPDYLNNVLDLDFNYGGPGFSDVAVAGGGAAVVDQNGSGWPMVRGGGPPDGMTFPAPCDAVWPAGGTGCTNSLGAGGGDPHGSNGGGGRGGDDPGFGDPTKLFGGNGGAGQTWQDSDTLEWAGPGGGGGGAGFESGLEGGEGGNYGGGGGAGGSVSVSTVAEAISDDLMGHGANGVLVIEYEAIAPDGVLQEFDDLEDQQDVGAQDEDPLVPALAAIQIQRWLVRTGHFRLGELSVDDLRLKIKRGIGGNASAPTIWVRANRNNAGFGKWVKRSLGLAGDRMLTLRFGNFGTAHTWQFEIATPDDCEIELRKLEIMPTQIGH